MDGTFSKLRGIQVELFGSLAKTGRGHGTDIAIMLGLQGEDPATCDTSLIDDKVRQIRDKKAIWLLQEKHTPFDPHADLIFRFDETLPYYPNGMRFSAVGDEFVRESTYYFIGGGFVVKEGEAPEHALAVNEENALFGRVVTAPTNEAAGVIPAVLMYYVCFYGASDEDIIRFLLVAEIAMEHHLGLTCDPVGGLVQVPCIERNAMGAMKAITAVSLALQSSPEHAKVSLDKVIRTMWQTAKDMNDNYKETSEGGLAVLIPVNVSEC